MTQLGPTRGCAAVSLLFLLLHGCTTSLESGDRPPRGSSSDERPVDPADGGAGGDTSTPAGADAAPDRVALALAYGRSLVGTPYGWWYEGPLPAGAPMWTADADAPDPAVVRAESANCTGLTNLMLRSIGGRLPHTAEGGTGGTYSYRKALASVAVPFDVAADYPAGTLIGRRYRDTFDQGHVAVVLEDGQVLQSFAWKRGGAAPGVNMTYTVEESHDGGFYEYAVLPEDWLLAP